MGRGGWLQNWEVEIRSVNVEGTEGKKRGKEIDLLRWLARRGSVLARSSVVSHV